ncbi:hypothetical protein GF319_12615 [Candidatus Bathyarchaeota archaeon]|nr:hypothetical protein [Candidatus Bathyarchaeota archaeon]
MMVEKSYDLIIEVSDGFLNKTLKTFYNEDVLPKTFTGIYKLDVPEVLDDYKEVEYNIQLTEPLIIDAVTENKILLNFKSDIELSNSLINIDIGVVGYLISNPVYNREKHVLELNVDAFRFEDINLFNAISLPSILLELVDGIIIDLFQNIDTLNEIPLSPIVGNFSLPEVPEDREYRIPLGLGKIDILGEDMLAIGFNIFFEGAGEQTELSDFSKGHNLALTLSQSAAKKIINHWWKYTTHTKSHFLKGRMIIKDIDEVIKYLSKFSVEMYPKLATLGFLELYLDFINIWMDYEAIIKFNKPSVLLKEETLKVDGEALLELTGTLRIELDIGLEFDTSGPIPDTVTPWKDDRLIRKGKRVIDLFTFDKRRVYIDLFDARATLVLDIGKRLLAQIHGFNLDLDIDWNLPRSLNRALGRHIEKEIISQFPLVPVSPSIISQNIEGSSVYVDLDIKDIIHREGEIVIHSNIVYKI